MKRYLTPLEKVHLNVWKNFLKTGFQKRIEHTLVILGGGVINYVDCLHFKTARVTLVIMHKNKQHPLAS